MSYEFEELQEFESEPGGVAKFSVDVPVPTAEHVAREKEVNAIVADLKQKATEGIAKQIAERVAGMVFK